MKQMKIGVSDLLEQIIQNITTKKEYKSKSSCVSSLLLSHPEIIQEMNTVLQNMKKSKPEQPEQNEENMLMQDDLTNENNARYYPRPITGKVAIEIQEQAKALGIAPTEYLVNCHKNIKPVILEFEKNNASELGEGFEELKKMISSQSYAIISILKNSQGQVTSSDLHLIENYQEEILINLESIKDLIRRDLEETASASQRIMRKIRNLRRQQKEDFS